MSGIVWVRRVEVIVTRVVGANMDCSVAWYAPGGHECLCDAPAPTPSLLPECDAKNLNVIPADRPSPSATSGSCPCYRQPCRQSCRQSCLLFRETCQITVISRLRRGRKAYPCRQPLRISISCGGWRRCVCRGAIDRVVRLFRRWR